MTRGHLNVEIGMSKLHFLWTKIYFNIEMYLWRGDTCHVGTLFEVSPRHRFHCIYFKAPQTFQNKLYTNVLGQEHIITKFISLGTMLYLTYFIMYNNDNNIQLLFHIYGPHCEINIYILYLGGQGEAFNNHRGFILLLSYSLTTI